MFSRCFATLLMFLAASPFNAPFCAVRLSEMFDVPSSASVVVDSHVVDKATAVEWLTSTVADQAASHARPVSRAKIGMRLDQALARGPVFALSLTRTHRISTCAHSQPTTTASAPLALRI